MGKHRVRKTLVWTTEIETGNNQCGIGQRLSTLSDGDSNLVSFEFYYKKGCERNSKTSRAELESKTDDFRSKLNSNLSKLVQPGS